MSQSTTLGCDSFQSARRTVCGGYGCQATCTSFQKTTKSSHCIQNEPSSLGSSSPRILRFTPHKDDFRFQSGTPFQYVSILTAHFLHLTLPRDADVCPREETCHSKPWEPHWQFQFLSTPKITELL